MNRALSPEESRLLGLVTDIIFEGLENVSLSVRQRKVNQVVDLIQEMLKQARIDESLRWHRYGGRDYDNELDEAIDERVEELKAAP